MSLLIIRVRPYDIEPEIEYILNDVESGEENKLCVVIEAYSLNMGLEYLDDLFPILKKKKNENLSLLGFEQCPHLCGTSC